MLLLSSLHIHKEGAAEDECAECVQHHCSGHIAQDAGTVHHCVLCQYLSVTFCAATFVAVVFYGQQKKTTYAREQSRLCVAHRGFVCLRGPPFAF